MADDQPTGEPGLWEQTVALGTLLRELSDQSPTGTPSDAARQAFSHWLEAARLSSSEARYFDDIAENFDPGANTNRDLFVVFDLLHPYLEIESPDDRSSPLGTFVSLPIAGDLAGPQ